MPDLDDDRRQLVNSSGMGECRLCHKAGRKPGRQKVHREHAAGHWQWCYNCHAGSDDRPLGLAPPVTQPSEACGMCHDHKRYNDVFPFKIHKIHAGRSKCYTCHQAMPPLLDWPEIWLSASAVEYAADFASVGALRGAGYRDRGHDREDEDDDRD